MNKIRDVLQNPNVIVTHTDAPELYVWNTERQKNRAHDKVCRVISLSLGLALVKDSEGQMDGCDIDKVCYILRE